MERRKLDFQSLEDVRAEVTRLAARPYQKCGQWDLATICDHLTRSIEVGLNQTPIPMPFFFRLLAPLMGPMIFKHILKSRTMASGIKAPAPFVPARDCEIEPALARLSAAIDRAQNHPGPMPKHPFFGKMTVDQWRDLMVVHAMHHLSFLCPSDA